jgi:hypothetical protein
MPDVLIHEILRLTLGDNVRLIKTNNSCHSGITEGEPVRYPDHAPTT